MNIWRVSILSTLVASGVALSPTPLSAVGLPNLVARITPDSDVVAVGETAGVSLVVSNRGTETAYNVGYNLLLPGGADYALGVHPANCSASRVGSQTLIICMETIMPGGNSRLEVKMTYPIAGSYQFSSDVDPSNLIRELRETDNTALATVDAQ